MGMHWFTSQRKSKLLFWNEVTGYEPSMLLVVDEEWKKPGLLICVSFSVLAWLGVLLPHSINTQRFFSKTGEVRGPACVLTYFYLL